jgi:hypothetical protein
MHGHLLTFLLQKPSFPGAHIASSNPWSQSRISWSIENAKKVQKESRERKLGNLKGRSCHFPCTNICLSLYAIRNALRGSRLQLDLPGDAYMAPCFQVLSTQTLHRRAIS